VSRTVRVIIVNTDEQVAPDLRSVLLSLDGVKIVAELDEPALLTRALEQFPAEVLLVHLDPNPAGIMDVVAPPIEAHKERIAAIAMTEDRDAQLVMRAMRAGMREFLWKPFPPEQLGETLRRVADEQGGAGRRHGRLIAVLGTCGGVGSTSLAVNLASELADLKDWDGGLPTGGHPRVVLVDMDFRFGQVAMQLDIQPTYTIAELCDTPEQIDPQMIERAVCKHASGLHVLARPADFAQAERISAGQCAGALAALQEHYDLVVVDLPSRFDPTARAVFDMADSFLIVMHLMVPSVRNTDRMLHELARSGYALERVRLVCNRSGRESGHLGQADVEATLKRKIDFVLPDDWRTSSQAVNMGAPLISHASKSKLRLAYRKVAETLAGNCGASATPTDADPNGENAKKRLFGFLSGAAAAAR
jgi:pilus assembly protein CpaE